MAVHEVFKNLSESERLRITGLFTKRAVAQLGSALVWGTRGRRFKSCQPDVVISQEIGNGPNPLLGGSDRFIFGLVGVGGFHALVPAKHSDTGGFGNMGAFLATLATAN